MTASVDGLELTTWVAGVLARWPVAGSGYAFTPANKPWFRGW